MFPDQYLFSLEVISTIAGMEEFAIACLRTPLTSLQSFNALALSVQVSRMLGLPVLQRWAIAQCELKQVLNIEHEAYYHFIMNDEPYWGIKLEGYLGHYFGGQKAEAGFLNNDPDEMLIGLERLMQFPHENCKLLPAPLQPVTPLILYTGLYKELIGEDGVSYLRETMPSLPASQREVIHTNFYRIKHSFNLGGLHHAA